MPKQETRFTGIDFLRFVCAFLIVYGHEVPAGLEYTAPFICAALFVFFIISGYFYSDVLKRNKLSATLYKHFMLLFKAYLVYLVWDFWFHYWRMEFQFRPDILYQYTMSKLDFILHDRQGWLNFLFYNIPPFGSDHLWYLPAILYVYLIVSFLRRVLHLEDSLYYLIPILCLLQCFLYFRPIGNLSPLRGFLYPGIPCFLLGDFARRINAGSLPVKILRLLLLLSCALLGLLPVLFSSHPAMREAVGTLGTLSTAFFLFLLVTQDFWFFHGCLARRLAYWGRTHGANIYIYHFLISRTLSHSIASLSVRYPALGQIYSFISPVVVFLLSLLLSMLLTSLHQVRHKKAATVS